MEKNKIVEIEKFIYRNIEATITYSTSDKSFHACSKIGNVFDDYESERGNFTMGFETPVQAINAIKDMIDNTIAEIATTTYEELAAKITSFVFDIHEDIDADTLRLILDNFKPENNGTESK